MNLCVRMLNETFILVLKVRKTFAGPLYNLAFLYPESRYSLFRRYQAGTKDVWHVHGDSAKPSSMVLGYDQYAGSLQKIRNYVTEGVKIKALDYRLSSAVKNGVIEFERNRSVYSCPNRANRPSPVDDALAGACLPDRQMSHSSPAVAHPFGPECLLSGVRQAGPARIGFLPPVTKFPWPTPATLVKN
ncbi:hypothetical protein RR51_00920 [Pseudomonas sp. C5pp]|nr:hypothetical protein RR51_00920 [Pseudomonas sp. C5pp]